MTSLHPQLEQDCLSLGKFRLCRLLLMNDSHYPWFILVPMRDGIREIHELCDRDQQALLAESVCLSRCLQSAFRPDKLNIAALGNIVPQLHIHHIVRYTSDPAWPAPVWGALPARAYTPAQLSRIRQRLVQGFEANPSPGFEWQQDKGPV